MTAGHNYLGVWWLCKHIKAVVPGNLSGLSSGLSSCSCFVLGIVALVPMQPLPPAVSLVGDSLHKLIIQGPFAAYLYYMAQLHLQLPLQLQLQLPLQLPLQLQLQLRLQLQLQSVTACVALDSQVQPVKI